MIDDNWQEDYGVWEFHPGRFSDPKDMMNTLHDQGFKVMLWICPYFSPDCETFRLLNKEGLLPQGQTRRDLHPQVVERLQCFAGSDESRGGRLFPGATGLISLKNTAWTASSSTPGDASAYHDENIKADAGRSAPMPSPSSGRNWACPSSSTSTVPAGRWPGSRWPNVFATRGTTGRTCSSFIPDALALGLMGYAYICPDMIGGGEYSYFYNNPDKPLDQELIVRSAQCSALMPMMQFSVAPWRVLSEENMAICRDMALLHEKMGPGDSRSGQGFVDQPVNPWCGPGV